MPTASHATDLMLGDAQHVLVGVVILLLLAIAAVWARDMWRDRKAERRAELDRDANQKRAEREEEAARLDREAWRRDTLAKIDELRAGMFALADQIKGAVAGQTSVLALQHQEIRTEIDQQWGELRSFTDRLLKMIEEAQAQQRKAGP